MKLILFLLPLVISISVFAQGYTITRFEASDYEDQTLEVLSQKLGDNASLLPDLQCDGRELDPFSSPLRINPLRNSLKIKVPKELTVFTYQNGRLFDEENLEVISPENPFVSKVFQTLKRFEDMEVTAKLLRNLEESYFPLTISRGKNSFNPTIIGGGFWSGVMMAQAVVFLKTLRMSPGRQFFDIGSGGQILWNPDTILETTEEDGVKRPLNSDVALAHEMYHAFDSIRGVLDMGMVHGESYEFLQVVEYRGVYFENLVRREMGIKLRKNYAEPDSPDAPDLLDENRNPIYIPHVCL